MLRSFFKAWQMLGVRWESRTQATGALETRDSGNSLPLLISPSNEVLSGRVGTSVQRLIDDWSQQADVHAAVSEPRALIIQAGRFRQDVVEQSGSKCGYDIIRDRVVHFPVFTEGLATRSAGLWCTVAEISMLGIIKRSSLLVMSCFLLMRILLLGRALLRSWEP